MKLNINLEIFGREFDFFQEIKTGKPQTFYQSLLDAQERKDRENGGMISSINHFKDEDVRRQMVKNAEKSKEIDYHNHVIGLIYKDNELLLREEGGFWVPVITKFNFEICDPLTSLIKQIELETKLSKTTILDHSRFEAAEDRKNKIISYNLFLRPGELLSDDLYTWKRFPKEAAEKLKINSDIRAYIKF